jgi:tetratricopeptide (TPR) repeat protein
MAQPVRQHSEQEDRREGTETPRTAPPPNRVLRLQGEIGNAAVSRLLARDTKTGGDITGMQKARERALRHYEKREWEQALAAFAEAFAANPISTFLRDQADVLEKLRRFDEAAEMYERYLAAGPLTADVMRIRSRIRKLRGEQVPEGEDDDAPEITATGEAGARAWFDRAQAQFTAGRFAYAAASFRKAFELKPLAAFIFNEGSALEKGRHLAAAANAFEHYLYLDPNAKDAKEVLGKIKTLRGQVPPVTEASLIDPEDEPSQAPDVTAKGVQGAREWFNRGQVAYQLGDYKRAYDCFVQAYDLKPFSAFVYNQAASLDRLGNVDGAVQAYERYLALEPKASDAGKVRERIKRLREAPAGAQIKQP